MSQEKTVTVRRRMNKNDDWDYQIWPSDLPGNAPAPAWLSESDSPGTVAPGIMAARLDNAFEPLPCGEEEAVMLQDEWDSYLGPMLEDDTSTDLQVDLPQYRDDERWGSW
ncbi:hypothetical protein [Massilia orientalis]|uniref:Uncharacterized protein n=1 Tax=Massilia orientalis TaxID=3050128 RepID=A0ACC7MFJ5_9BURK|nr:hypothetical protein [Massilia sp. YIM B02787]